MNPVKQALKLLSNQFLYDPQKKRMLPNSPLHAIGEMKGLNPKSPEFAKASTNLGEKLVFGGLAETPAKRALLDVTGRKVLDNSGMIDALAKQLDEGAMKVQPGKMINLNLDTQARDIYKNVFNRGAGNSPVQQVIAKLKEAADGYRMEQMMKVKKPLLNKF